MALLNPTKGPILVKTPQSWIRCAERGSAGQGPYHSSEELQRLAKPRPFTPYTGNSNLLLMEETTAVSPYHFPVGVQRKDEW